MNDRKHNDKYRRKSNYDRLKRVGFNSYEANRYKDFSDVKIDNMIEARVALNAHLDVITRRAK